MNRPSIFLLLITSLVIGWIQPFDSIATDESATFEYETTDFSEESLDQATSIDDSLVREQTKTLEDPIRETTDSDEKPLDQATSIDDSVFQEQMREFEEAIRSMDSLIIDKNPEEMFREEIESFDLELKEDDYFRQSEEIMERSLSEWEEAIREYDELVTDDTNSFRGDGSYDDLERKMRELLKEISATDLDLEKITSFGDPREEGVVLDEIFRVTEIFVEGTFVREDGIEEMEKMVIRGTGPPESNILVFIYSTPIMVSTKTDTEGNWSYVLEREIEDGRHEVYVASADNTGKILAKSAPTPFVKEAAAVQVDLMPLPGGEFNALGFFDGKVISVLVVIFFLIIITTIILAGISIGKRGDS